MRILEKRRNKKKMRYLGGFLDRKKIAIVKMSFTTCYLQVVYRKTGGGSVEIGELKDTPYRWVFGSESEATMYLSRWQKRIHWYLQGKKDKDIVECSMCKKWIDVKVNERDYNGVSADGTCDVYFNYSYILSEEEHEEVPVGQSLMDGSLKIYVCSDVCYDKCSKVLREKVSEVLRGLFGTVSDQEGTVSDQEGTVSDQEGLHGSDEDHHMVRRSQCKK